MVLDRRLCSCYLLDVYFFILISSNQFTLISTVLSQLVIMANKDSLKKAFAVQEEELKNPNQDDEHVVGVKSILVN